MQITYLSHSGFLVETEHTSLLFDYYEGNLPPINPGKPLYVFVSHSHHDHYNRAIYHLENEYPEVTYFLSSDIEEEKKANRIYLGAGEKTKVGNLKIETYLSTDLGIAFLVETDGKTIFHAGDFHWWHWIGEPDQENEEMKKRYLAEMDKIKGRHFDVAFLVLDPRQEEAFDWGFDYFMKHTRTDIAFPMHFWKDFSVIRAYKNSAKAIKIKDRVMDLTKEGQVFLLE